MSDTKTEAASPPTRLLHRNCALFLDFDGTLADLADDPSKVQLPPEGPNLLSVLSEALNGAVALVSGRDGRDLASRTPRSLWRVGNHGDMLLPPGSDRPSEVAEPPAEIVSAAQEVADAYEGVWLERKARVLALHTRGTVTHATDLARELEVVVASIGGYKLQTGKDICELKPESIHKGYAIERLMDEPSFRGRAPVFFGDDTTDEDGFAVCLDRGGSAVKVGAGDSMAPYRLENPRAVWSYLKKAYDDFS